MNMWVICLLIWLFPRLAIRCLNTCTKIFYQSLIHPRPHAKMHKKLKCSIKFHTLVSFRVLSKSHKDWSLFMVIHAHVPGTYTCIYMHHKTNHTQYAICINKFTIKISEIKKKNQIEHFQVNWSIELEKIKSVGHDFTVLRQVHNFTNVLVHVLSTIKQYTCTGDKW